MTLAPSTTMDPSKRIVADPRYGEVVAFLIDEANLLNDDRQTEWLEMLTDDVRYRMPFRKTTSRADGLGFDGRRSHYNENRSSLAMRVRRNEEIIHAYDRDPRPRTRRLVGNVVVHRSDVDDEFAVHSAVVLLWSRFDVPGCDVLSAQREDIIRRTPDGLRLANRVILLDQSLLASHYTNVLL